MIIKTKYPELFIFVSTAEDGDMSEQTAGVAAGAENYTKFLKKTGIDDKPLYFLHVLHSDKVTEYPLGPDYHGEENTKTWPFEDIAEFIDTDAVVTDKRGTYFALGYGDCNPVVMYDHKKSVLGYAHCGWRSTVKDLHLRVLSRMTERFGTDPADVCVTFGPAIRPDSYGFRDRPSQADIPGWEDHITFDGALYHIDLAGYMRSTLISAGVPAEEIAMPLADTYKDDRFFSHYKAMQEGLPDARFILGCGIIR